MSESQYERAFETALNRFGRDLPEPAREHEFHPTREWRFDFAWPDLSVAVEIDGGNWMCRYSRKQHRHIPVGRHSQADDYWKINEAEILGWRVLRFTGDMIDNDPDLCVDQVREAIQNQLSGDALGTFLSPT